MKILCETQVYNRETHTNKTKAPKATVAIGFHHKNEHLEIVHFTPQNKTGLRYKLHDNIQSMFTKFLNDGKVTISFKSPPENLMIKCDPIQLKSFLQVLKLSLQGKMPRGLKSNVCTITSIPTKSQPVYKMIINKRSDIPIKGYPRTLKTLIINGAGIRKVTFSICSLRNLTCLKLPGNNITTIPDELGKLPLTELDLSDNDLGEDHKWRWMTGRELSAALRELDMSNNKLTYFPCLLTKFRTLVTLKLNNNMIERLPFALRSMKNLRYLQISKNKLVSLPSSIDEMRLEQLNVWENNFQPICEKRLEVTAPELNTPPPLWEKACQAVLDAKLPFGPGTLPSILVDILSQSPRCYCGKICFGAHVWERAVQVTLNKVKDLVFSRDRLIYSDIVVCSSSCASKRTIF